VAVAPDGPYANQINNQASTTPLKSDTEIPILARYRQYIWHMECTNYVTVTLSTGWPKKTAHYTLVHIFAKY